MTNVQSSSALREALPRVDRVARRRVLITSKKIGVLNGIAGEARLDATDRQVLARYARETFHRAKKLRDRYELSDRAFSRLIFLACLVGLPIGATFGLVLGVQYVGFFAMWIGMALGVVIAAFVPLFLYYSVAYLLVWKNLATDRRKFLRGLEGV